MPFDNLCKYLAEQHPLDFAEWILGYRPAYSEVLKTELSIEPVRADFVTFLKIEGRILHIEFQVNADAKPPMEFRLLEYWVRLYRQYQLPITQVVVLLKDSLAARNLPGEFRAENTFHRFHIIRMWEQPSQFFLNSLGLVPLGVLTQTSDPGDLLRQVATKLNTISEPNQRRETLACAQILAGLRFDKNLIKSLLRERVMRESVIYQEILEEGLQEGHERGLQQGLQEGLQQGLQQGQIQGEQFIILRMLAQKLGNLPDHLISQIKQLPASSLEILAIKLFDISSVEDVQNWLASHPVE